jgi:hypothetical protein
MGVDGCFLTSVLLSSDQQTAAKRAGEGAVPFVLEMTSIRGTAELNGRTADGAFV